VLKLVLAGAVAVPVATVGAVAATGVVVVDVREGRGGQHLVIPIPLAAAQVAAAFVPERDTRLHLGAQAERYLPVAREVLSALAAAEDAELVKVKEGSLLHVRVHERGQQVDVQVPIAVALSALPEAGGRISVSQAVWALQHARLTRVVDVQGADGEHVKVTVY